MITAKALEQTLRKLTRLEDMLYEQIFTPVDTVSVRLYESDKPLYAIPAEGLFGALPGDGMWGGEGVYGWFRGTYTVPAELDGKPLYLYPRIEGYEATLWVDGRITSNYANKEIIGSHGNHYAKQITAGAKAGQAIELVLEYYAHHDMPGTFPFTEEARASYRYPIGPVRVCLRDDFIMAYWADLRTLRMLAQTLPETSFRRADVLHTLYEIHTQIYYDEANAPGDAFRAQLAATQPLMQAQLAKHNGDTAPYVGLVGHSHMDTAWLWPIAETVNKCARTYAHQMQLLEQYPEYRFVQSSAYHTEMIRLNFPELFERIKQAVADGRYEPNGGVWVECDCNLTGGEYMVRQFLWGQRYTQEHFGYRSDTFWLPDTFGYSYSIPQIMRQCDISYFLTTKIAWGDTNKFPYTTFYWQGLDGTRVLTHMNRTHVGPDPEMLFALTAGDDPIMEKPCTSMRLFSYGKGDGGGGPEFEMIEMSRRLGDLEGCARTSHTSVSGFMQALEAQARDITVYADELYLELHRGTLTSQHDIKRNNRLAEIALRNLELFTVKQAIHQGAAASSDAIRPLLGTLLVNQFHDILPGTSIHSVHALSKAETGAVIQDAGRLLNETLPVLEEAATITVLNPLGFDRADVLYLPDKAGMRPKDVSAQKTADLDGNARWAVAGVSVPSLGSMAIQWEPDAQTDAPSPFEWAGDTLTTPHAKIRFDAKGFIRSYIDAQNGRELCNPDGYALGTLLLAEDVPASWDNWDIDADLFDKFAPCATLLSREVIAEGAVELRIRSTYRISEKSTVRQDMVFYTGNPMVTFDTLMDWQDEHRFLKAAFDTTLVADGARHEIQFGNIRRSNHRSTTVEKARFEVCNHKYTDLSETGYGIALLNDCKYGIGVEEGSMWLSLHKGGTRPDREGDCGQHRCRYAFLPHDGAFSAQTVIQPAYAFNYAPICVDGVCESASLLRVSKPNIIVEAVKPCEDADRAYIVRLYEAEGAYTNVELSFGHPVASLDVTNMLEEKQKALDTPTLTFKPFEIKTIRVAY